MVSEVKESNITFTFVGQGNKGNKNVKHSQEAF